jgi:molybdenum cofactor guanylyltransferase
VNPKSSREVLLGIFVGGQSSRMGGEPKGLLPAPGEPPGSSLTLVGRLAREFRKVKPNAQVVLVGQHEAYVSQGFRMLGDSPLGVGPVGGLRALLLEGISRNSEVVACSCDLPFLGAHTFARLLEHDANAVAVAFRRDGRAEPFPSRYDAARAMPMLDASLAAGKRSLKAVLQACPVVTFELDEAARHELDDWDTPEDTTRVR